MTKFIFSAAIGICLALNLHPAHAQSACSNVNLYEDLKTTDPTAHDEITALADETVNGEGLFWKVSHEDDAFVSYLFGTMHKSDPRILDVPKNVRAALLDSKTFAGEIDSSKSAFEMGNIIGSSPELLFAQDGTKLTDHLQPQTVATIDRLMNERGEDFDQINAMQPWFSVTALSLSLCDVEQGLNPNNFLDAALEAEARQNGTTIVGLETVRSQIESLNAIDKEFFYISLDDAAAQYEAGIYDDLLQTATALYLDEKTGVLLPLSLHFSEYFGDDQSALLQSFQRELLETRNQTMVEKSAALIDQGPTFIAVGALHLVGETGLVEGLRNQGYAVERVKLER